MRITARRLALLACSVALNVFLLFAPPSTVTLSARGCQQDCDNDVQACGTDCNSLYEAYSDDWVACHQTCQSNYNTCSSGAEWCTYYCGDYYQCVCGAPPECECYGPYYMCGG